MKRELRKLPSVDILLQGRAIKRLLAQSGREVVVASIRAVLEEARSAIGAGQPCPDTSTLLERVVASVSLALRPTLRPVINATGVILHTNLGRAPLSVEARLAMERVARGYSNLEYDLEAGERGSRYLHAEDLLSRLTGAEAGLVVNNNAAALLLILTALARGKEVIISRSQLVEIGGGFRIPEVMAQSGAKLVEVGTTNRTYKRDYAQAIGEETAALLRVHHSNFRIVGFTHEVKLGELVELAREHNLLVFDDLGSGALLDTAAFGLAHEPLAQESIAGGADLVCFSGDKLLGGPQGGIIIGRRELIACLREHPLTRAVRVDKTTLAGLQATLLHYLKGEAVEKVPVWRMIATPLEEIEERARGWARRLEGVEKEVIPGRSAVGGGSLPGQTLPTYLLALTVPSPQELARRLRMGEPAVVGRIEEGRYLLDPRTVLPEEDEALLKALEGSLTAPGPLMPACPGTRQAGGRASGPRLA
ncbi:MAG: L-seryl-tRNA(Sec) selenium transferase [Anaerolineae bacterium]